MSNVGCGASWNLENCVRSWACAACTDCVDCEHCVRCQRCKGLNYCADCVDCESCWACVGVANGENLTDLEGLA